jgi:predicted Zn-dependent protease
MDAALRDGPPVSTAAILRAGFLARHGLLHDARLQVADALARQPDEPTLHFLLGELAARQGLPQEAMEAFAEARFLLGAPALPR